MVTSVLTWVKDRLIELGVGLAIAGIIIGFWMIVLGLDIPPMIGSGNY